MRTREFKIGDRVVYLFSESGWYPGQSDDHFGVVKTAEVVNNIQRDTVHVLFDGDFNSKLCKTSSIKHLEDMLIKLPINLCENIK